MLTDLLNSAKRRADPRQLSPQPGGSSPSSARRASQVPRSSTGSISPGPRKGIAVRRHALIVRCGALTALTCTALVCCSCSSAARLQPVRGKVLVDGQPPAGAVVVFHPVDQSVADTRRPVGRVEADGTFTLSTFNVGEGAPAGQYIVAISRARAPSESVTTTAKDSVQMPPKYGDVRSSPLRATVTEGTNEMPTYNLTK
jgi:hypothetical protein